MPSKGTKATKATTSSRPTKTSSRSSSKSKGTSTKTKKKKRGKRSAVASTKGKKASSKSREILDASQLGLFTQRPHKVKTRVRKVSRKRLAELVEEPVSVEMRSRRSELEVERNAAKVVLKKHRKRLKARKGVVGLDVGLKMEDCQYYRPLKYVIRVHVQAKRAVKNPRVRLDMPIEGIDVDVLERRYRAVAGGNCDGQPEIQCFREPMSGGVAITADDGATFGTLGMQVSKDGVEMYLTNRHVANVTGNEVLQPPFLAAGVPKGADRLIGNVSAFGSLNSEVDCALIEASPGRTFEGLVLSLPADVEVTVAERLEFFDEGSEVFKVGAKTGSALELIGIIDNVEAEIQRSDNSFVSQISITSKKPGIFADEGDSGAIVLRKQEGGPDNAYEVVGLVHTVTQDKQTAIASHIEAVFKKLGCELN